MDHVRETVIVLWFGSWVEIEIFISRYRLYVENGLIESVLVADVQSGICICLIVDKFGDFSQTHFLSSWLVMKCVVYPFTLSKCCNL